MDGSFDGTKPSLEQQGSGKSLERFLRRNADLERFLTDRKEEAVSRLWPEQRQTLENLYSHVISTDILSTPQPKKEPPRRINTIATRSLSASYIEEKGLMRKLSFTSIWQSRKRSFTPSCEASAPKPRPSRIIIPERSTSVKPKRSRSDHFGSSQLGGMGFGRSAPGIPSVRQQESDNKENWAHEKTPSRTRSFLHRLSPEKYTMQSRNSIESSSPTTTAPVSPVTHTSSFSEKRIPANLGISGSNHSFLSMHGRIKRSLRGRTGFRRFFTSE
ncbi:hypothetical protein ABW19_dt0210470 [Dactylella cylindrospora]|nr:hypothetical protein ABW19_dt0210470 [Dactylella cylindrospora]